MKSYRRIIRQFSKRIYFIKYGRDLNRQSDAVKEQYDNIIEDLMSEFPIRCPVYQCSGFMKIVARKPPRGKTYDDEYEGDEHTPDMICTNCGARYNFGGFKK